MYPTPWDDFERDRIALQQKLKTNYRRVNQLFFIAVGAVVGCGAAGFAEHFFQLPWRATAFAAGGVGFIAVIYFSRVAEIQRAELDGAEVKYLDSTVYEKDSQRDSGSLAVQQLSFALALGCILAASWSSSLAIGGRGIVASAIAIAFIFWLVAKSQANFALRAREVADFTHEDEEGFDNDFEL